VIAITFVVGKSVKVVTFQQVSWLKSVISVTLSGFGDVVYLDTHNICVIIAPSFVTDFSF